MKVFASVIALAGLAAGAAPAATTYASSVIDYTPAGGVIAERSDPSATLGMEDNAFTALGRGGEITLGFDGPVTGEIRAFEVTYGSASFVRNYPEAVDVFALSGGVESFVGRLGNAEAQSGATLSYDGVFEALRLVDVTAGGPSEDGFDIDAISVTSPTPVPLPASAVLLLGGLAGMGAMRRRGTAKAAQK